MRLNVESDALPEDEECDAILDECDAERMATRAPVALSDCYTLDDLRRAIQSE